MVLSNSELQTLGIPKMLSNELSLDLSLRKITIDFIFCGWIGEVRVVTERLGEKKTRKGQWHWDGGKRTIHEVLRK